MRAKKLHTSLLASQKSVYPVFAPRGQVVAALAISFNPHLLEKRADWLITQITRAAYYARAELRVAAAHR